MTAPAKAKVATIKLEPGTDLVGTVKFVSFYPEKDNPKEPGKKMSAQWALLGDWNGTEGRVYIDTYKITNDIMAYIAMDGEWPDGSTRYKWIGQGPFRLHPYIKEKRHYVTVLPDGERPTQQSPDPADEEPANGEAKAIRKRWADLQECYESCLKIAAKAWRIDLEGIDTPAVWVESVAAGAHTLFIEASKRNLPPPPKRETDQ